MRLTIGNHHLTGSRERGGEESLLPVAVETEDIAQVADTRHAAIVTIVDDTRQFAGLEPHPEWFPDKHPVRGLVFVAHVEIELNARKGESLAVDIESAVEQRILLHHTRLDPDHILQTVIDVLGDIHAELIGVELLFV